MTNQNIIISGKMFAILASYLKFSDVRYQELMSAAKERQTSVYFANHLLSNHTCANCPIWKTSVNCVSDLSRCDKCLLKLRNKIIIKIIINRLSCVSDKMSLYNPPLLSRQKRY